MHVPAKANALLHWLVLSIHLVFLQHAGSLACRMHCCKSLGTHLP